MDVLIFFLAGFVFTATTALAVVRLSPLFAEVSFSFPLDPLCWRVFRYFHILATASGDLFSAWRSGHTAAFLCCLEPRIVLFVFSLISEDMWRVMWLFIVRHVTCRCGEKNSHCVKTFCDKNVLFCFVFLQNWNANIFSIRSFKVNGSKLTVCFVLFIHKKSLNGDGVKWQTGAKNMVWWNKKWPETLACYSFVETKQKNKNQRHYLAIIYALTLMKHPHPTQHCYFILFYFFLFPFTHNTWLMI